MLDFSYHIKSNDDLTDRYEDIEKLAKEEAKGIPAQRYYYVTNNFSHKCLSTHLLNLLWSLLQENLLVDC